MVRRKDNNSDELYHWKYIKRVWDSKNGKYKYYYKDEDVFNADIPLTKKLSYGVKQAIGVDKEKAYKTMKNTVKLANDSMKMVQKERQKAIKGEDGWGDHPYRKSWVDHLGQDQRYYTKNYKSAKETYDKVLADYKTTPLYKIRKVQSYIDTGKKKVKELLNRIF